MIFSIKAPPRHITDFTYVSIPPKLTNPSGLSWRVPNFNIRSRI